MDSRMTLSLRIAPGKEVQSVGRGGDQMKEKNKAIRGMGSQKEGDFFVVV